MSQSQQAQTQTVKPKKAGGKKAPRVRRTQAQITADKEAKAANGSQPGGAPMPSISPTPARLTAMAARAQNTLADPVIGGLLVDFPNACGSLDKAAAWLQVAASTFTLRGLQGTITITARGA
jgi:hypothetical protein